MEYSERGLQFSPVRIVGGDSGGVVPAFLLGTMFGCVTAGGTSVLFLRPAADLTAEERATLADQQIAAWERFKTLAPSAETPIYQLAQSCAPASAAPVRTSPVRSSRRRYNRD